MFHVRTREMKDGVDAMVGLRDTCEFKTSVLGSPTSTPCYVDREGVQRDKTRYAREQIIESLRARVSVSSMT